VLEAGERWLLLGVTAAQIQRIGTLPKGELPPATSGTAFSALLAKVSK
jgi:flagellar biogenesis protein FliO